MAPLRTALVLCPLLLVGSVAEAEPCCTVPTAIPAAPPTIAPRPGLGAAELDRLRGALEARDAPTRVAAARALATAGSEGMASYAAALRRPLTEPDEVLRALVHAVWGQYPNPDYPKGPGKDPPLWFIRPEPRWTPPPRVPGQPKQPRPQRPPKHDPETVDWLEALAALEVDAEPLLTDQPPELRRRARGELLFRVALLRAIAAAGREGERGAVAPLFEAAFMRDGIIRDECGRAIRSMGSYAVPALIRIYNDRTRANAKMRRYASYQLDRMDRLRPSKAVSSAPDDATRAEIIHAYGEARALDAVEAVLGQVDSGSARVRREARWAWLRYVDGPPPPPAPKRKRKLPGGAVESEEKEDYLNYRDMATLVIHKKLGEVLAETGEAAPPADATAKAMTDRLLSIYDRRREAEFAQLFQRAKDRLAAGDAAGAVDGFGWILAHQPDHPRRAEMADAYRALGQRLAGADPVETARRDPEQLSRAVGFLRQAQALAEEPTARRWAEIHYIDGLQAEASGGSGQRDFTLAVAADPDFAPARRRLRAATPVTAAGARLWPLLLLWLLPLGYLLGRRVFPSRGDSVSP